MQQTSNCRVGKRCRR